MVPKHAMLVLALAMMLPMRAAAQAEDDRPWRNRARTFLVLRITDALQLSEEEAVKVGRVIREADERRQALLQQRKALVETVRAALAKSPPDRSELGALIAQANDLDQQIALAPESGFRDLQKILTVEQQGKLLLLRGELQGEIRRAIRNRAGSRRRGQGLGRGPLPGEPPPGQPPPFN